MRIFASARFSRVASVLLLSSSPHTSRLNAHAAPSDQIGLRPRTQRSIGLRSADRWPPNAAAELVRLDNPRDYIFRIIQGDNDS